MHFPNIFTQWSQVFLPGLLGLTLLAACGSPAPVPAGPTLPATGQATTQAAVVEAPAPTSTPILPTSTPTPAIATCAEIDATWAKDWPAVLDTLDQLIKTGQSCGEEPLLSKKYAAHFSYGAALEKEGQLDPAIEQYRAALFIDSQRREALEALFRLKALPKPTPPACLSTAAPRPDPATTATPAADHLVTVQGDHLELAGRPFVVKGVNYYPRQAPWQRFLTEADPAEMARELDLIQQAGFNTIRVFLWYEPLFTCQPEDAIPNEAAFATVDTLFRLAGERDLKVIVALNDLPDLLFRPLYTDWAHYDNQTVYIVRRYRHEPALLAWDLRNEVDIDWGAQSPADARFKPEEVLQWIEHLSGVVREHDPHHLLTAGWWGDPTPAEPYVDFLSFHHWTDDELPQRIKTYRQRSTKPLMLQEVGFSSGAGESGEPADETAQSDRLAALIKTAEAEKLAGWLVWTAFDFVPAPGQAVNPEHFFGLWRVDLTPKPALKALPLAP